jgi:hypothetical protein
MKIAKVKVTLEFETSGNLDDVMEFLEYLNDSLVDFDSAPQLLLDELGDDDVAISDLADSEDLDCDEDLDFELVEGEDLPFMKYDAETDTFIEDEDDDY